MHHCGRLLLCSSGCSSRVSLGKHTGNIASICCVLQKRIGSLGVDSHCIISDTTQHTTSTVYAYQKTLLDGLKVKHSAITKVHYFSDGCTGQYLNRYNFINLCFHNEDCELLAEWNFFATSHGKTACDGIGDTNNQILNPHDVFTFCNTKIPGIEF